MSTSIRCLMLAESRAYVWENTLFLKTIYTQTRELKGKFKVSLLSVII